jgi:hypothetical protein
VVVPTVSEHELVVLVQPVHENCVGPPVQLAWMVIVLPANGVELLGVRVHTGTAGTDQLTCTAPTEPVPKLLVPLTKYVCAPVVVFESWQLAPLHEAEGGTVQVYDVGLPVQFALSVIVWPTVGFGLLVVGEHTGVCTTGGGGGVPPPPPCQRTSTVPTPPVPKPLVPAAP